MLALGFRTNKISINNQQKQVTASFHSAVKKYTTIKILVKNPKLFSYLINAYRMKTKSCSRNL